VLMLNPPSIVAASAGTTSQGVLGSITSHGSVRVGEMFVPSEGTLFSGDRVQTNNGSAVIQYRDGARIMLASGSLASFAPAGMQLEKGLMSFQTVAGNGMIFAVSTLRLEPTTAKAAANVTLKDSKASVAVTEGTLKVVDPSGVQLASLHAGDARLFEEAGSAVPSSPASSPAAASSAAPPQGGGGSSHNGWKIALGAAVVGVGIGVAALVRANDSSDSADKANASAAIANAAAASASADAASAKALAAQLQSQVAALTTQLSAAQAQLTTIQGQSTQSAALIAQLQTQIAAVTTQLNAANASLSTLQGQSTQSSALVAQLQSQIAALTAQANALIAQAAALQTKLTQVCNAISATTPCTP
jgi:hypothetical protein